MNPSQFYGTFDQGPSHIPWTIRRSKPFLQTTVGRTKCEHTLYVKCMKKSETIEVQSNLAIRAFLVRAILALKVKLLLLSSFKKKFRYLYFRPRKKMKKANTQYFY